MLLAVLAPLAVPIAIVATSIDEPPDAQRTFEESLVVRELEVWFDASVLPPLESIGRRGDRDFSVLQDGILLERIESPARAPDRLRAILLWFDEALASPPALERAAKMLASAAPSLAGSGPVEIAIEGRDGSVRRAVGTADALAEELLRLARRWATRAGEPPAGLEARLDAVDRLALELVAREGSAPRALLLVAEPWPVDASLLEDLATLRSGGTPSDLRLVALEDAARLIAASGWVAYALDAREPETERPFGRRAEQNEPAREGGFWPLFTFPIRNRPPPGRVAVALDLATDLGLRPLAHLVRASSGTLVGEPGAIERQLARLRSRRRLVVRSPELSDGRLARIEVRWTGGDGRPLPASGWVANGEPPEVAAARKRLSAPTPVP